MDPNSPEAPTEPALLRALIAHPLTRLLLYVLTPLGAGAILLKAVWRRVPVSAVCSWEWPG